MPSFHLVAPTFVVRTELLIPEKYFLGWLHLLSKAHRVVSISVVVENILNLHVVSYNYSTGQW